MRLFRYGALLLTLALIFACRPSAPPVVTMESRACVPTLALDDARPVALDGRSIKVVLDEAAACWHPAGGVASAYAAFRLPSVAAPYILSVVSEPIGQGLLR